MWAAAATVAVGNSINQKQDKTMKKTIYIRVSTEAQSYDRQMYEMKNYFNRMGMSMEDVDVVQEKITSYTKFNERAIYPVLNDAQEGDMIYVCQLDRLGRTVEDIISLVKFADSKGLVIISIKENQQITYKSQTGKMMLTLLAMVAEMERELRAERCQAGINAAKEEIRSNGYRIARVSGKIQTRLGNEKGYDMSRAVAAQAKLKQEQRIEWMNESVAYKWVIGKFKSGMKRTDIVTEFNKLRELQPDVFCSRRGAKLTPGLLSHWLKIGGYR